ncbi:WD40-repeat-containing domain protein [Flammula alnicola]|nr:WD40-repeat-containing domain protein [Flammula alnicola]
MSYKKAGLYPPNPVTTRGVSTKLSSGKDKIIYTSGRTVLNPGLTTAYSGHIQNATVARLSPSVLPMIHAVKIWDVVGEDQILKGEYKVISGRVYVLPSSSEKYHEFAIGMISHGMARANGSLPFGHAFMMDSGSSTGEILGHSKTINAVSIRHQRPFRAATAGDDALIIFHTGAPYKYEKTIKTHTKFVQDVQYAPSGDHFASVGSDAKIFLYDGKTGDTVAEFTDSPHKGSIMACSWSPDSKSLLTSSADCTVKLWDAQTQKAVTTWTVGSGVSYQQVGNTWSGQSDLVSLSMSGDLNVFDPRTGDKPVRILSVSSTKICHCHCTIVFQHICRGTADGRVYSYSPSKLESTSLEGEGHSNHVSGLTTSSTDGKVYSVGFDDRVREIVADGSVSCKPASAATTSQPKSIAVASDSTVFIAEIGVIEAFRSNQKVFETKPSFEPSAVAAAGSLIAIGEDRKVHFNEWDGKTLKEIAVLESNQGVVSALAFSPDGKYLASGDSSGKLILFDAKERKLVTSRWAHHTARINSLSWTSDSAHCASGSLDTHVYIWSVAKLMKNIPIKNAGPGGVNGVLWLDGGKGGKLVSSGFDGCVRAWDITFHA